MSNTFLPDLFQGKVALVTGGGSGIGRTITERLCALGCSAIILGRREHVISEAAAAISKSTGSRCEGFSADVRDAPNLEKVVKQAVDKFGGKLDFVVLAAAGNFLSPLEATTTNAFQSVVSIDLLGTWNCVKATLPYIKSSKSAAYLAISATFHYMGTMLQGPMSAAKAGIDALSRSMAIEFGPQGIRSNVIAPGPIGDTPGLAKLSPKDGQATVHKRVPLQRVGKKDDIADAAIFLLSPAASYITGTEVIVDGGSWQMGTNHLLGLPYPESLEDPQGFRKRMQAKL